MKRYGNLWEKITSLENIKLAHKNARKGKLFYTEVKMVDADLEKYALEIQYMLLNKTFTTSPYAVEDRFDGRKQRTIHKLPYYPDRIIQHALLNVIGPILEKSFIRNTFQSIKNRGTSDAAKRVKKLVRSEQCPPYALKIDVQKYYPSVNNEILKQELRRKIKCLNTLWLIDNIVDSIEGLPIGNYTSQHFGNLYLSRFDWFVVQILKPAAYFRYCDDILVFDKTTQALMRLKAAMLEYLATLKLTIKKNWNIFNIAKNGVDFVGYRFKPEYTRLRKSIRMKFRKAVNLAQHKINTIGNERTLSSIMAYKGWCKRGSAKMLWRKQTKRLLPNFPKQLRNAI